MKFTKEQALVVMGYTGIATTNFSFFYEDVEKCLGRPIWTWTHEFANEEFMEKVKAAYHADFISMCSGDF